MERCIVDQKEGSRVTSTGADKPAGGGRTASGLADLLRTEIESGEIRAGRFMPSEREVSRARGVSKMTVRRAMKVLEGEGLIAAEPRQGYRVLGRALDPSRGYPVAFVVSPDEPELVHALRSHRLMLAEFQRAASARGWSLLAVGAEEGSYGEVMSQLESGRVCGAFLASWDPPLLERIEKSGVPALMIEAWQGDLRVDSVMQDGFGGGLTAASYLFKRGHRRFGWLGLDVRTGKHLVVERYSGALGGLMREGLGFSRQATAENREDDMERAARELLSGPDRPTAIFALWQTATTGLARAARELGLKVGEDFEMVGWANEEEYDVTLRNLFDAGRAPAAVTWRVGDMAEAALGRLAERRVQPRLRPIQLRIQTVLNPGDSEKWEAQSWG
jgi:DNA-binding LacI/PurR family transcriptional regulator